MIDRSRCGYSVLVEQLPLRLPCLVCGRTLPMLVEDVPRERRSYVYPPESVVIRRGCPICGESLSVQVYLEEQPVTLLAQLMRAFVWVVLFGTGFFALLGLMIVFSPL